MNDCRCSKRCLPGKCSKRIPGISNSSVVSSKKRKTTVNNNNNNNNNNNTKENVIDLMSENEIDDSSLKTISMKHIFLGMLEFKLNPFIIFSKDELRLVCSSPGRINKEEVIKLDRIDQCFWGLIPISINCKDPGLSFISIILKNNTRLNYVTVGKGKMLDVSLTDSENCHIDNLKSSKYVLFILPPFKDCNNHLISFTKIFEEKNIPIDFIKSSEIEKHNSNLTAYFKRGFVDEDELNEGNESGQNNRDFLFVYPWGPEDKDCITIFNEDIKRLIDPEEYLNDNLIDLKIKHLMIENLPEDKKKRVLVASCQFYTKLTEKNKNNVTGHALVARWTKSKNTFDHDYIFIPINSKNSHWSVFVICNARHWIEYKFLSDINTEPDEHDACILHMDSLGSHRLSVHLPNILNYLSDEWKAKTKLEITSLQLPLSDNDSRKKSLCELKDNLFENIPILRDNLQIPRQTNGWDCGLFTICYIKMILDIMPTTTKSDRDSNLNSQFSNYNEFNQDTMSQEREDYRTLLNELTAKFNNYNIQLEEQKLKEKENLKKSTLADGTIVIDDI